MDGAVTSAEPSPRGQPTEPEAPGALGSSGSNGGSPSRRRQAAVLVVLALIPWTWFLLRDVHPLLGLVAIGLPLAVLAAMGLVAVVALVLRRPSVLALELSLVAFGAAATVGPWLPSDRPEPTDRLVLLSANMTGPEDPLAAEAGVESVRAVGADVVVVAELSPIVARLLARSYPYHVQSFPPEEQNPQPPAVGVFSRLPIAESEVRPQGLPGIRAVIEGGRVGRFALYAVHVPKPALGGSEWSTSFAEHDRIVDRLAEAAEAEDDGDRALPVVVAGDLNSSDRSAAYRRLDSDLHDAARAERSGPTSAKSSLLWRLLALRIDHVFTSRSWCSADNSRPRLAVSDHRGVRVELGPCPGGRSPSAPGTTTTDGR